MNEDGGAGLLYQRVADVVGGMISSGTLRPGDRVPSIRQLSRQESVSVTTVIQAFTRLENQGLIEARPQSGFYVRAQRRELPPEPRVSRPSQLPSRVALGDLVSSVLRAARDPSIIPLGAACPDPSLFPSLKLNRMMGSIARRMSAASIQYDFPPGCLELRREIARRALDAGAHMSPDDLITTCGGTEAIHLCIRAVAWPGDTIAVESPAYYGLLQMLESFGMRAVEIPTHPREGMDLDALKRALRRHRIKACLLVSNFSNPLGCTLPDERKQALVELLAARRIPLIEDDIYGDLYFGSGRPRTCKAFDTKGWVLLCSSFSKTIAPGYRVGWTAPGIFRDRVQQLKTITTMATASLAQLTLADFLRNGGYDHTLRGLRRTFATQVDHMTHAILRYFPAGTCVTRPEGGFVLWVQLPKGCDALRLHQQALEQGISIAPGLIFSARQQFRNCIRLNCGYPWSEQLDRAMIKLGRLATTV